MSGIRRFKYTLIWWRKFFKYGGFRQFGYKWLFKKGGKYKIRRRLKNRQVNSRALELYGRRYLNHKQKIKTILYKAQKKRCAGCKNKFMKEGLTIDHKKRVSDGGTSELKNLRLLCRLCHEAKDGVRLLKF